MKSRLTHVDLKFARSVLNGRLDCTDIVGMLPLSVPGRRTRRPGLFHVPRGSGRVDCEERFLGATPPATEFALAEQPSVGFLSAVSSPELRHSFVRKQSGNVYMLELPDSGLS